MMERLNNIRLNLFFLLLILGSPFQLAAQEGKNPFDLSNGKQDASSQEETPPPSQEKNPFDLNKGNSSIQDQPAVQPVSPDNSTEVSSNPFDLSKNTARPSVSPSAPTPVLQPQKTVSKKAYKNFLFWISILLLVFMTVLFTLYKSLIVRIYRAFLNDNILKLLQREQGLFLKFPFVLIYFFFFLSAGFFIFLVAHHYEWVDGTWSIYFKSVLGVAGIYLLKHLALRILGYIFPIDKELRQYSFTILVFNIIVGLCLLPFCLLIAFGPELLPNSLIIISLAALFLILGFRIIRSLLIGSRYISLQKFHFFMYLCTVEIAPTLVLVKLLLVLSSGAT